MKSKEFEKVINEQIEYCRSLLIEKGKEYALADTDRLLAFKQAGIIQGLSQKEALCGMMAKHTISVYSMCQSGNYSLDKWTEKITDSINYLLLLRAIVEEEHEKH